MKTKDKQNNSIIDPDFWYNHHLKQSKIHTEIVVPFKNKKRILNILKLLKKLGIFLRKKTNNYNFFYSYYYKSL